VVTKYNKKLIVTELVVIIVIVVGHILVNSKYINLMPECYFREHYGILCPSCGGTRCVINFLNGNFLEALKYHVVFFITILYLIMLNIVFIINNFKTKPILEKIYPKWWYLIIWGVVLLLYTIIRNM